VCVGGGGQGGRVGGIRVDTVIAVCDVHTSAGVRPRPLCASHTTSTSADVSARLGRACLHALLVLQHVSVLGLLLGMPCMCWATDLLCGVCVCPARQVSHRHACVPAPESCTVAPAALQHPCHSHLQDRGVTSSQQLQLPRSGVQSFDKSLTIDVTLS
jgi:hypothetical protein